MGESFVCNGSSIVDENGQLKVTQGDLGDAFDVFGLPATFNLDGDEFEKRYIQLSKLTHPDHSNSQDQETSKVLLSLSALVNSAYQELKSPLSRAETLLTRLERQSGLQCDVKDLPGGFLMEMLELQEELDDFRINPEDHEDRLEKLEEEMEAGIQKIQKELDLHFKEALRECGVKQLQTIRTSLNQVKYFQRVATTVEELLDECE